MNLTIKNLALILKVFHKFYSYIPKINAYLCQLDEILYFIYIYTCIINVDEKRVWRKIAESKVDPACYYFTYLSVKPKPFPRPTNKQIAGLIGREKSKSFRAIIRHIVSVWSSPPPFRGSVPSFEHLPPLDSTSYAVYPLQPSLQPSRPGIQKHEPPRFNGVGAALIARRWKV